MSAPRIAPLQPPYEAEMAAMLARWMPPGSGVEPLALFRTLAVHDGLFSRMRPLGAGILGHPRLDPRERELLILAHARGRGRSTSGACTPSPSPGRWG